MMQSNEISPTYALYRDEVPKSNPFWSWFNVILLGAFLIDLINPFFAYQGIVPTQVRWLSDAALAVIIVIGFIRILVYDHVPKGALLIAAITIVGTLVALFEGQGLTATAWGWWKMFRFPMVGIYCFLQQDWPDNFEDKFQRALLWILGFQVLFQIGQYITGETPGDHLAGTFGRNGVGQLLFLVLVVVAFSLGYWLFKGEWKQLVIAIVLGTIASVLGEMKLFPFALAGFGVLAFLINMIRGGQLRELAIILGILIVILPSFFVVYNVVVAEERGTARLESYFNLDQLDRYLNNVGDVGVSNRTYFGRGFALSLGWENIQRDVTTFLFGMGIGARGESVSLNIVGQGLRQDYYGLNSGTSLLVFLQELGLFGLMAIALFIIWASAILYRDIKQHPEAEAAWLRYGLMLFTIMWPLWLWYHSTWEFSVSAMIYWVALAYVLRRADIQEKPEPELAWLSNR